MPEGTRQRRKVLCSIGSGAHAELLEITRETFAAYAARHGYEVVLETGRRAPERPPAWDKVLLLRELAEDADTLLWLDADAVVVDTSRDIAAELRPGDLLGLVERRVGRDRLPNTGVMVLRGGPAACELLDLVWAAERLINHPWWENAALLDVLGYRLPGWERSGPVGRALKVLHYRAGVNLLPCVPVRPSRWRDRTRLLELAWNSTAKVPARHPRIEHFLHTSHDGRVTGMLEARDRFRAAERRHP